MVTNKQLTDQLGKQAAACVETVVNQKCRELFEQQLAPRFANSVENSSKQVGHAFSTGTAEYLKALEAHGKATNDKHKGLLDAHVNTVQKQLGNNQSEIQKIVRETVKVEMMGELLVVFWPNHRRCDCLFQALRHEMQQSMGIIQKQFSSELQNAVAEQNRSIQTSLRYVQRSVANATPIPEGNFRLRPR